MQENIYHITTIPEWQKALELGEYQPAQFEQEGFIHCSYKHQLITVANRFFKGKINLVILVIDCSEISSKIVTENLEGGTELYPHIYGKLPLKSAIAVLNFNYNSHGDFFLPPELLES